MNVTRERGSWWRQNLVLSPGSRVRRNFRMYVDRSDQVFLPLFDLPRCSKLEENHPYITTPQRVCRPRSLSIRSPNERRLEKEEQQTSHLQLTCSRVSDRSVSGYHGTTYCIIMSLSSAGILRAGGGGRRTALTRMLTSGRRHQQPPPPNTSLFHGASRRLSTTNTGSTTTASTTATRRPVRPATITAEERAAVRATRKERATAALRRAQGGGADEASAAGTSSSSSGGGGGGMLSWINPKYSRFMWYAGLGIPTVLITWGIYDKNSPPAQVAKAVGLADFIGSFTSHISAPVYDKLLPDWADVSVSDFPPCRFGID